MNRFILIIALLFLGSQSACADSVARVYGAGTSGVITNNPFVERDDVNSMLSNSARDMGSAIDIIVRKATGDAATIGAKNTHRIIKELESIISQQDYTSSQLVAIRTDIIKIKRGIIAFIAMSGIFLIVSLLGLIIPYGRANTMTTFRGTEGSCSSREVDKPKDSKGDFNPDDIHFSSMSDEYSGETMKVRV